MLEYAYYNGVITPYDSAVIPLSDRSIFFAEAVYDVMIGRNGIAYQLDEHLLRLISNAKRIGLGSMMSEKKLKEEIKFTLDESMADNFLLYVQLSANQSRRTHSRTDDQTNLLITVTNFSVPDKLEKISAILLPDLRYSYCDIKTTNLLPSVLSIREAEKRESDIAIFHKDGIVTEASHANVSIIKDGLLISHPKDNSVLPGISELNLIRACENLGIKCARRFFAVEDLLDADAVLVSSTTKLVRICSMVDGIPLHCKDMSTIATIFEAMQRDLLEKTSRDGLI